MILYKYYGYEAGITALKSSRLAFRKPRYFNDPFELSYLNNLDGDENTADLIKDRLENIRESVAILSLTKNPLNPLMWAHYAVNHTGFVIGYDTNIPFLMDEKYNLVTADKGDVIYTSSKPPQVSTSDLAECIHVINLKSKSVPISDEISSELERMLARKLYLTKYLPWAYEEEVRVVKSIEAYMQDSNHSHESLNAWTYQCKDDSPNNSVEMVKGLKLYSHKVQIKEVYLGDRNKLLSQFIDDTIPRCPLSHTAQQEGVEVFRVFVNRKTWHLNTTQLSYGILIS